MGAQLSGPGGDFWWDVASWYRLLRIAMQYGWQPAGTVLPQWMAERMPADCDWDGGYLSNDCQLVSAADAGQLAAAVERAWPDIPDADMLVPYKTANGGISLRLESKIQDMDWFSGPDSKRKIQAFILFCRAGRFEIS